MSRSRAGALSAGLVLLGAVACSGGETAPPETTTVVVTESETTALEDDRAYLLALDFCANAPLETVALVQPGSPADVARRFSSEIRPELREAALEGCLVGLERGD